MAAITGKCRFDQSLSSVKRDLSDGKAKRESLSLRPRSNYLKCKLFGTDVNFVANDAEFAINIESKPAKLS